MPDPLPIPVEPVATDAPRAARGPRPWLAGTLAFLAPGVGHVYARRSLRGAGFLSAVWGLQVAFVFFLLRGPLEGRVLLLVALVFLLGVPSVGAWDAARCARRVPSRPRAWWASLLAVVGATLVVLLGSFRVAYALKDDVVEVYRTPSGSMEPSLVPGDRFVVDKLAYAHADPARGDLVVYRGRPMASFDDPGGRTFVKRVVGLPGDHVEAHGGSVYVNEDPLPEPYLEGATRDFEPLDVPEGEFLVLGDRRSASIDSRRAEHGFVPRASLVGRVARVLVSVDDSGRLRWDRVGIRPR